MTPKDQASPRVDDAGHELLARSHEVGHEARVGGLVGEPCSSGRSRDDHREPRRIGTGAVERHQDPIAAHPLHCVCAGSAGGHRRSSARKGRGDGGVEVPLSDDNDRHALIERRDRLAQRTCVEVGAVVSCYALHKGRVPAHEAFSSTEGHSTALYGSTAGGNWWTYPPQSPVDRSRAIQPGVAAIILAGGSSTRLGSGQNKVFAAVGGRPVLAYSLETCATVNDIVFVVVVVRPAERAIAQRVVDESRLTEPVVLTAGGPSRLDSELAGLDVVRGAPREIDVVAIHDGARPFATAEMFEAVIVAARSVGGGVPALSAKEPLFSVADATAVRLEPEQVVAVQTPQAFRRDPLLRAYERARSDGFDAVDTAQTVERYGHIEVAVAAGDRRNLKITYASDLVAAEAMASAWAVGRWV